MLMGGNGSVCVQKCATMNNGSEESREPHN